MHRLTSSFVLGYHGCDRDIANRLLAGEPPKPSKNDYDWLGNGVYFWEANPLRGLEFAREASRHWHVIKDPAVIGAIIEPGLCLDLTTSGGIEWVRIAYESLVEVARKAGRSLPLNTASGGLRRNLDRAVIQHLHAILEEAHHPPIDTVKGIFIEGEPIYMDSGFYAKTHVQIAVCNVACIKGVFRVPDHELQLQSANNPI